jgi:hypothetical protein
LNQTGQQEQPQCGDKNDVLDGREKNRGSILPMWLTMLSQEKKMASR